MKPGTRIRNIHTKEEYTVLEVIPPANGHMLRIYEVANANMETHRFNSMYEKHFELVGVKVTEEMLDKAIQETEEEEEE